MGIFVKMYIVFISGPKKKPKESDHLWKIVLAFVVIIGIATAAIYFIGERTSGNETAKTDESKSAKEKPVKDKASSKTQASSKKAKEKTKMKPAKKDKNAAITNAYDKTILNDLDEAEKLLKAKQVEKAKRAFEKLVREHPNSPRAMYGLARSLDDLADLRRSNQILQEAIDSLGKVGNVKDCPMALKRLAVMRQAERASFLGKTNIAVKVLEDLAKSLPSDLEVYNKLGVQFLLHGNQNRAKKTFKEV